MIRNQWYIILESREVRRNRITATLRLGKRLVLWRSEETGQVCCVDDRCPHRGASLSCGCIRKDRVQCPFHGLEFDGAGTCKIIPANGSTATPPDYFRVPVYETQEAHGFIWLWWGDENADRPPLPFFEDIDDRFCFATVQDPWKCHYSRCIENQLDAVHVPFVHRTTIGRGNRTLVNGPRLTLTDRGMTIYVHNEKDEGQLPKPEDALPPPNPEGQHLEFRYPHIWQNYLTPKFRIFIAFVPVDDHNTILYMRVYQRFMKVPLLKQLVNRLNLRFSIVIAHQDRKIVETQVPDRSALQMQERLIPGDRPIIAYRKQRDALQKANPPPRFQAPEES